MEVTYEIRQSVSTVHRGWMATVSENSVERVARKEFHDLHTGHPSEYFELVQVARQERCLLFVQHLKGSDPKAVRPDERGNRPDAAASLWHDQVQSAIEACGNPTVSTEQVLLMLQAARRTLDTRGDMAERVRQAAPGTDLSSDAVTALVSLVDEARRGPALVDAGIARYIAERSYGTRYGVDWVYYHDKLGVLSERELEAM